MRPVPFAFASALVVCSCSAAGCSRAEPEASKAERAAGKADPAASKADPADKMVAELVDKIKSLPSPADFEAFPAGQGDAARAVAESIRANGEDPREFHAQVMPEDGTTTIVFDLWHESAFADYAKNHGLVVGNPGGKCRKVYYDREKKQVTKTQAWQ